MDDADLQNLMLLAGALLAIAAAGSVAALQLQRRQKRVLGRIDSVSAIYARGEIQEEAHRSARRQVKAKPALHRVALLFGYDIERAEDYPVQWWLVLPGSVLAARIGAQAIMPLLDWVALALVPPAAVLVSRAVYGACVRRRRKALFMQFPDALAMIVRGVRVGVPVAESMRTVARESMAPTAGEFRRVADRVALGVPLEEALQEMAVRNGISEYRFFATAIGLQSQTGGGLSEALENLADVIRKRLALRARGYALASEARTSIFILCALPIITGIALSILNPSYMDQLFNNPMGQKVFAGAVLSFSTGLAIMQIIVRKSLA